MSPKVNEITNINNTSKSNVKKDYRYDDASIRLSNIPRIGKNPPSAIHSVNNNNNTVMRMSYLRASPHDQSNITPIEDHETSLMQDVLPLALIIVSSNTISDNVSDQSISVAFIQSSSPITPMDTSSTNDPFIKKANKYMKKKLKQEPMTTGPTEFMQLHIPTDMLINVSKRAFIPSELISPNDFIIDYSILIPKEIMDITFNEIISESIDMIVDQLDSTHLSEFSPNLTNDQLSARYSPSSTSTGILDKSHSFIPSNTPSSQKDPCIKNIKNIRHKKEYLKSIKVEESSSNHSQHALSPSLKYTYDGFIAIDDIKLDSSIQNHEELLTFIELFM
ncbi:hypothetical protein C1645_825649 [Glomus cerebriforme]|uniref:Uncharacterized protein n=1 Tax=Glomus cerebriforme TaxID=658196 RepID=A0A397SW66_9GLOM|nr:hypothetical protein C1645_825649 [Glomus cerebriforme]